DTGAPHDRDETATVPNGTGVLEQRVCAPGWPTGKNDDPPSSKRRLNDVGDAIAGEGEIVVHHLVGGSRLGLLDVGAGQLYLDDVGAQKRRHVRSIGNDVEGGLALLGELGTARIGPEHHGKAKGLGLGGGGTHLLDHLVLLIGSRIDRIANGGTSQLKRVPWRRGHRLIVAGAERIGTVGLEDQGYGTRMTIGTRGEQPEWGRERAQ